MEEHKEGTTMAGMLTKAFTKVFTKAFKPVKGLVVVVILLPRLKSKALLQLHRSLLLVGLFVCFTSFSDTFKSVSGLIGHARLNMRLVAFFNFYLLYCFCLYLAMLPKITFTGLIW